MSRLVVEEAGPATSVQDCGRIGVLRFGLSSAGAMDRQALAVANVLVGQPADAAAIEIGPFGARFSAADGAIRLALSGAARDAAIDGQPVAAARSFVLPAGAKLALRPAQQHVHVHGHRRRHRGTQGVRQPVGARPCRHRQPDRAPAGGGRRAAGHGGNAARRDPPAPAGTRRRPDPDRARAAGRPFRPGRDRAVPRRGMAHRAGLRPDGLSPRRTEDHLRARLQHRLRRHRQRPYPDPRLGRAAGPAGRPGHDGRLSEDRSHHHRGSRPVRTDARRQTAALCRRRCRHGPDACPRVAGRARQPARAPPSCRLLALKRGAARAEPGRRGGQRARYRYVVAQLERSRCAKST